MSDIRIRAARPSDREQLARMRNALWPDTSPEEHSRELRAIFEGTAGLTMPLATFVAVGSDRTLLGFLEVDLRSHADGCDPAHSVGYVEGWYVAESHRRRGIGKELLAAAENWARKKGCIEMASDTWIDNETSQRVHDALGYEIVDRCVHYRKNLRDCTVATGLLRVNAPTHSPSPRCNTAKSQEPGRRAKTQQ